MGGWVGGWATDLFGVDEGAWAVALDHFVLLPGSERGAFVAVVWRGGWVGGWMGCWLEEYIGGLLFRKMDDLQ